MSTACPVTLNEVAAASAEVEQLIGRFCGGRRRVEFLTEKHPSISLAP